MPHVLRGGRAQLRQPLGEADELVELRLFLLSTEVGVVQVLAAPGGVDAGRLQLRIRLRGDPDVFPRRRDHEGTDALELLVVLDRVSARVDVAEASARAQPSPTPRPRHAPG